MIDSYISSLLTTFIAKRAADERPIQDEMNQTQMADAVKARGPGEYEFSDKSWPRGEGIIYDPRTAAAAGGASNLKNEQRIQMRQDGSAINPFQGTAWRIPGQGDAGGLYGNAATAGLIYAAIKALQNLRTITKPYNKWPPAQKQTYVEGTLRNLAKGKDSPIATGVNTNSKGAVKPLPVFPMTPKPNPKSQTPSLTATPEAAAAGLLKAMARAGVSSSGTVVSVTGTPTPRTSVAGFNRSPGPGTSSTSLTKGPSWANAMRLGVTSRGAGGNRWTAPVMALAPSVIGAGAAMLGKNIVGNDVETNPDGGYWGVIPRTSSSVGEPFAVPALPLRYSEGPKF